MQKRRGQPGLGRSRHHLLSQVRSVDRQAQRSRMCPSLGCYDRRVEFASSREKALRWVAKPNRAVDGASPISLLASDAGALAVERVLGRIEHGVFA